MCLAECYFFRLQIDFVRSFTAYVADVVDCSIFLGEAKFLLETITEETKYRPSRSFRVITQLYCENIAKNVVPPGESCKQAF